MSGVVSLLVAAITSTVVQVDQYPLRNGCEENDEVVATFLAREPGLRRAGALTLPETLRPLLDAEGALRTWPHRHGMDGFFAVRLEQST